MKKRVLTVLLTAVCILSLSGCQKSPRNIYGLLCALSESFSEEYGPSLLYSDSEVEGFDIGTPELLGRLYLGRFEEPSCASKLSGFAIRLPLDDSGFEIHILKCVNVSDTEEVSELVGKRIDRLQNAEIREYAPESYERYFVGAEVFVWGDTVFLLATPDNLYVKNIIKKNKF